MLDHLIWADYAILGVIGLSVLMSLWRGFMREAISLATWIAAFVLAFNFSAQAAVMLEPHIATPSMRQLVGFGAVFLATLVVGGIVNLLVGQLIAGTGLGTTDRMLGVIFGALRGIAVITVLVLLAGMTPVVKDPWWGQSLFLHHFEALAAMLKPYLPPELADGLQFLR